MSTYYGKLLELKGIENKDGKFLLKVMFSFKETTEILWEVDEYTANSLNSLVQFDDIYKYRLSFKTLKNNLTHEQIGIIIRTFRENSEIIHFSCSEDYINMLNAIKNLEDISDMDKLPFILTDCTSTNISPEDTSITENSKESIFKFSSLSTAIIGIILFMVLGLGYIGYSNLSQTYFNEKVLAESVDLDTTKNEDILAEPVLADYLNEKITESLNQEMEISIANHSPVQDNISSVELEETITYDLPKGMVALTFDDGPSQYTKTIVNILREYGVGGTFFLTGSNVEKYPDHVEYIHSNGYSIGSHSINHFNMTKLSYEKQKDELIGSFRMLEKITNENLFLFRPPYGSYNKQLINLAVENEYKIVLWNNDPEDWKTRNADKIYKAVETTDVSGAIILLHESQAVIDSLPIIIEYLQDLDLEIVNLK